MEHRQYRDLLKAARRVSRRAEDAEDLLHATLLAALEAGRATGSQENRRWMAGVLRRQAALSARGAVRARQRETAWLDAVWCDAAWRDGQPHHAAAASEPGPTRWSAIAALPPALRIVALLALSGHTRGEIRHLLRLSDQALRQRLTQLRRRWSALVSAGAAASPATHPVFSHLVSSHLAFGTIRSALLPLTRRGGAELASHDPDGHLFAVGAHKTPGPGNKALIDKARRQP